MCCGVYSSVKKNDSGVEFVGGTEGNNEGDLSWDGRVLMV